MAIGKGDFVLEILSLYDELEEKSRVIAEMEMHFQAAAERDGGLSPLDERMLEAGRKKVYEASMYSWNECRATRDDETGSVSVTPYDKWLMDKIRSIPDYMSKSDFCEYFADRSKGDYEREKQDSIAEFAVTSQD